MKISTYQSKIFSSQHVSSTLPPDSLDQVIGRMYSASLKVEGLEAVRQS